MQEKLRAAAGASGERASTIISVASDVDAEDPTLMAAAASPAGVFLDGGARGATSGSVKHGTSSSARVRRAAPSFHEAPLAPVKLYDDDVASSLGGQTALMPGAPPKPLGAPTSSRDVPPGAQRSPSADGAAASIRSAAEARPVDEIRAHRTATRPRTAITVRSVAYFGAAILAVIVLILAMR
jgi:hypothetical protein